MGDMEVDIKCEHCHEKFMIDVETYEQLEEANEPYFCPDCLSLKYAAEAKVIEPPKRCFEYMVAPMLMEANAEVETMALNIYGQQGWEMITAYEGRIYFKREYFKEAE